MQKILFICYTTLILTSHLFNRDLPEDPQSPPLADAPHPPKKPKP